MKNNDMKNKTFKNKEDFKKRNSKISFKGNSNLISSDKGIDKSFEKNKGKNQNKNYNKNLDYENTIKKEDLNNNIKDSKIRINKYISESGFTSRREADRLIGLEKVLINGEVATIGSKVSDYDEIVIDGKLLKRKTKHVYYALNKPRGIETTTDTSVKGNVISFINVKERVFPIGRLDKDSNGLLLLTDDGDIVNKILRSRNGHDKEYIVGVNKPVTQEFIESMKNGVPILDTITKKCKVTKVDDKTFNIVLTQGLNRQIRRMCEYFGYKVIWLKRVRIMNIHLGNLKEGSIRHLSPLELTELNNLIKNSHKHFE